MNPGRRRHSRIAAKAGDVSHPHYSCLDLSESGMKFSAKGSVDVGSHITVEITALTDPVTVQCKVMWCREATSFFEQGCHFGVMFQNLSVQDQFRLRELIEMREG